MSVQIDSTLGEEAGELFERLGLNLSTAVNLFLRQSVREQAIPFRVGRPVDPDLYTREELLAKFDRGIEQIRAGYGISKTMEELEAMAKDRG